MPSSEREDLALFRGMPRSEDSRHCEGHPPWISPCAKLSSFYYTSVCIRYISTYIAPPEKSKVQNTPRYQHQRPVKKPSEHKTWSGSKGAPASRTQDGKIRRILHPAPNDSLTFLPVQKLAGVLVSNDHHGSHREAQDLQHSTFAIRGARPGSDGQLNRKTWAW